MTIRYPRPQRPGDRVGVTSPSSGVAEPLRARLDVAVEEIERRGYEVVVGRCMDGTTHISAPAAERAADAGQRHPHLALGQSEHGRDLAQVGVQPLGGDVEVDAAARAYMRSKGTADYAEAVAAVCAA